jgi:hypothetical protein
MQLPLKPPSILHAIRLADDFDLVRTGVCEAFCQELASQPFVIDEKSAWAWGRACNTARRNCRVANASVRPWRAPW